MTTATRTDIHRPSAIRPEDYTYAGTLLPVIPPPAYSFGLPMEVFEAAYAEWHIYMDQVAAQRKMIRDSYPESKGGHACDHCGVHIKYGMLFEHTNGNIIVVGEICADETMEVPTRALLEIKRERERLAGGREAAKRAEEVLAWIEEDPTRIGVVGWMMDRPENSFYADLLRKMRKYGPLSPGQEAAVRKGPEREAEQAARKAREEVLQATAKDCPTGRVVITGEIVSTKWVESDFGGSLKMLVLSEEGFKVWGTVPSSLDADRGDLVRFTGTVEPSRDDPKFGFFKRPAKAEVIGQVEADAT
jgi:hypothetical protein